MRARNNEGWEAKQYWRSANDKIRIIEFNWIESDGILSLFIDPWDEDVILIYMTDSEEIED